MSGADPIECAQLCRAARSDRGNGIRTVLVEDASRFARESATQEPDIVALIKRGVRVLPGSFAEYEKARLVASLKAARDRKGSEGGKRAGRSPGLRSIRRW